MKVRNGFTPVEIFVSIAIVAILLAMIIPSLRKAKQRETQKQTAQDSVRIGDIVYIDGMSITGKVNRVHIDLGPDYFDLLVQGTNGLPTMIEKVNEHLIRKVTTPENWRNR